MCKRAAKKKTRALSSFYEAPKQKAPWGTARVHAARSAARSTQPPTNIGAPGLWFAVFSGMRSLNGRLLHGLGLG